MTRREGMFDGAERATRFAHRLDRHGGGHTFFGLLLVGLGVLFLLDNLDLLQARRILVYWPVLLVAWGSYRLVLGRGGERVVGAGMAAFGVLFLGNRFLAWDVEVWELFWPVILMLVGLSVLTNSRRSRRAVDGPTHLPGSGMTEGAQDPAAKDGRTDAASTFKEVAILAGIERRNISQSFRGGDATAVMGGVELDLRECRMAGSDAEIDIFAMMGGVQLRIPKDWTVESRVTAILAGVEDTSEPPLGTEGRRLIVRGTAFLGGIEIKN